MDLGVRLGRLTLKNPVLVASGTFGYVREMAPFLPIERLGGVIPKTVTFHPRAGNATPRTVETAAGLLNAIGLVNTFLGMAIDWRRRRPILANDVGGLSGPAIKPLALRMVWQVARALPDLPIIGIGGIANADDAMEFLVAGASAVQVGTATFYDPTAAGRLVDDLPRLLREAGAG